MPSGNDGTEAMTSTSTKLTLAFAALLATSTASAQTYTTYTNRAAFLAAQTGVTVQDFNSFTTDQTLTTGVSFSFGEFSLTPSGTGSTLVDAPPVYNSNVNGSTGLYISSSAGVSNSFTFNSPISSFGADFFGLNDGVQRSTFTINGRTFTPPITSGNANNFFGIISSGSFTTASIVQSTGDTFALDNLTYRSAAVAAVPEPAAWTLMILGFGAVGGTLRQRRRGSINSSRMKRQLARS